MRTPGEVIATTGEVIETTEDLAHPPKEIGAVEPSTLLMIGDLHGNAMKLIYFLICYGVMELEDPNDYGTLWKIYNRPINGSTPTHLLADDYLASLREDKAVFEKILNAATIKQPKLITFIGDELSDRGKNDLLTLMTIKMLEEHQVNTAFMLSNHSVLALQSFIAQKALTAKLGQGQERSIWNLWHLVRMGVVTPDEIKDLAFYWKQNIQLIGYLKTEDKQLTLFTHAPVGLDTIQKIAEKFDVQYDDATVDTLTACIDQINQKAHAEIMSGDFIKRIDYWNDPDNQITANPLNDLFWAREIKSDCNMKTQDGTIVTWVHGHTGANGIAAHNLSDNDSSLWTNLDSDLGKFLGANDQNQSGLLRVLYALVRPDYSLSSSNADDKKLTESINYELVMKGKRGVEGEPVDSEQQFTQLRTEYQKVVGKPYPKRDDNDDLNSSSDHKPNGQG
jgi:hypothetical protein